MRAVVLAGGKGTRLAGAAGAPPKVLAPLAGPPALDHVLAWLAREGVSDVVLCLGHRAQEIADAVGDGARFGLRIKTLVEAAPLGTAGAVKAAEALLGPRFFVVYGDVICDVDLSRFLQAHCLRGAIATLAVHPSDHAFDSDRVVIDREDRVVRMHRKEDRVGPEAGSLVSAALYVVERELLASVPADGAARDFARDVFPDLARAGRPIFAYRTAEYIKDMGTPARRDRVEADLLRERPARMRRGAHRPALFTDRDGVLIADTPFLTHPSAVALLPGVGQALRAVNEAGALAVCCTNQPVVARGELSFEGLHEIHTLLEGLLGREGAWLDAIYTCPHHPDRGFAGERPELKIACSCRKPLPGLVFQATADLGVDRRASVFVGDRTVDLAAARAAGVLGIGVLTGTALRDGRCPIAPETPIVPAFADAVSILLETMPSCAPLLDRARRAGVVLVGGVSRSGKTVAASALGLALRAAGTPALHVSLDRFVQPFASRAPGATLSERAGFDLARAGVAALIARRSALLPSYDPLLRARAPAEMVTWGEGVLVVDGLHAAALDVPGALRLRVVADEAALVARRRAFYAWKGLGGEAIARTLAERAEEDRELHALGAPPDETTHSYRIGDRGRLEAIA